MRRVSSSLAALACLAAAGCSPDAAPPPEAAAPAADATASTPATPAAPAAQSDAAATDDAETMALVASGPAETLANVDDPGRADQVVQVDFAELPDTSDLTVKLYGTAGGDPAINGLYAYVSVFSPPDSGAVFFLGDVEEARIVSASATQLGVMLRQSTYNEQTTEVTTTERYVLVALPQAGEQTTTMTPAAPAP